MHEDTQFSLKITHIVVLIFYILLYHFCRIAVYCKQPRIARPHELSSGFETIEYLERFERPMKRACIGADAKTDGAALEPKATKPLAGEFARLSHTPAPFYLQLTRLIGLTSNSETPAPKKRNDIAKSILFEQRQRNEEKTPVITLDVEAQ